jgi:hypothetical protein
MSQLMTVEEWQSAFEEALSRGGGRGSGMSTMEIIELTGMGGASVKAGLRKLFAAGRLACHKEPRPAIDGVMRSVPVYSIIPAKRTEG